MAQDLEFPDFSRKMCFLLRELKREGKIIFQVEPYLERLIFIHELFSEGHSPDSLKKNTKLYPVYLAERNATGALLSYYQTVMTKSFDKSINAIQQFARMDAARFRLRDALRTEALIPRITNYNSVFIEAGVIHYPLWKRLRRKLSPLDILRPVFLAQPILKEMGVKGSLYGPGDLLTLFYIFHPHLKQVDRENILAARSLINSKIVEKEEITEDIGSFPHLINEMMCNKIVQKLSLSDCRQLFPLILDSGTTTAFQIVKDYLANTKLDHR